MYDPSLKPFYHGVASGDPLSDGVIIWTRITPHGRPNRIRVNWEVATDPKMANVVRSGSARANRSSDYTVKVDVRGLRPDRDYYYQFKGLKGSSIVGKTKTAPNGDTDCLKFAVISCSNFEWGYFSGLEKLAEREDLNAIIHLGDYIYEYADNDSYSSETIRDERVLYPAHETVTREDYWLRYATYRLDPNMRRAHQQHPFIVVWDDHESANDAWVEGAENHDPATEGDWEARKAAAKQAYFDWMPIRENGDEIYRKLSYGNLADIIMLDTRLAGRDEQILDVWDPALYAPSRTILGADQKDWLKDELSDSEAIWKIIGNQVIFSEFNIGFAAALDPTTTPEALESLFLDIWDGYPAERNELTSFIGSQEIEDVVFLTGDFHSSFGFEVVDPVLLPGPTVNPAYDPDTGDGAVAVEFATPSISAANFDENLDAGTSALLESLINQPIPQAGGLNFNPHMAYADLDQHGYFVLSLYDEFAQADYYYLEDILVPSTNENWGSGLYTLSGTNNLMFASTPVPDKELTALPAPRRGDINADGYVDWSDASDLIGALFSRKGSRRYFGSADLRADYRIDFKDFFAWYYIFTESNGY